MPNKIKEQESDKSKRSKTILIACVIIIIILLGIVCFLLIKGQDNNIGEKSENQTPKREIVVNQDNAEDIAEELIEQESVRPGNYEVTMNSTWEFQDGASASDNAYVENSIANTNDVYFDVQLADTEEVIYKSPVIPVGNYLDEIKLDKDLDAGTYDCVLIYHLVDENQETLSTLRMTVTIVVAN